MRYTINFIYIFISITLLVSCSSKKNVLYLQDTKQNEGYSVSYKEYTLKVDDILKIDVDSENPDAAKAFNSNGNNLNVPNTSKESLLYNGYQIDFEGNINFPLLGKLKISDLTLDEARGLILKSLMNKDLLVNPTVDIKLLNASFTIIGEVSRPGVYSFLANNLNILEAIGMAGDLTINGVRKDLKLIREVNENHLIYSIDLTSKNLIKNEYFQVFSGDIIIVNPNNSKVKNAGIIGNSGTLLSLLSFLLSSIIVISAN